MPIWYRDKGNVMRAALKVAYVHNDKIWTDTIYLGDDTDEAPNKIICHEKGKNSTLKVIVEHDNDFWDILIDMANHTHTIYVRSEEQ